MYLFRIVFIPFDIIFPILVLLFKMLNKSRNHYLCHLFSSGLAILAIKHSVIHCLEEEIRFLAGGEGHDNIYYYYRARGGCT